MKLILPLALVVGLTACAGHPTTSAKVDAVLVSLTTAERLALLYTSLPRCPAPAPCSNQAAVDRIKSYATTAHNAVKMAEQNEALLDAAIVAVSSFQNTIPATK